MATPCSQGRISCSHWLIWLLCQEPLIIYLNYILHVYHILYTVQYSSTYSTIHTIHYTLYYVTCMSHTHTHTQLKEHMSQRLLDVLHSTDLSEIDVVNYAQQVASAMHYLHHKLSILHCDLAARNISSSH